MLRAGSLARGHLISQEPVSVQLTTFRARTILVCIPSALGRDQGISQFRQAFQPNIAGSCEPPPVSGHLDGGELVVKPASSRGRFLPF